MRGSAQDTPGAFASQGRGVGPRLGENRIVSEFAQRFTFTSGSALIAKFTRL